MMRRLVLVLGFMAGGALAQTPIESPMFQDAVKAGTMAPVTERLPTVPAVQRFDAPGFGPGRHGGEWSMLISRAQDVRLMVVYGYARLVGYNSKFELGPDLVEKVEISPDQSSFTFRLRRGHKWSDGHPFTAEDFRYFWEDIVGNRQLTPEGVPEALKVEGKPPTVTVIDPYTVRYAWPAPNPFFLPRLAGPAPLYIFRPAHYLKLFHAKYADAAQLQRQVQETRRRNWQALHNLRDNMYRYDNPDLPTLEPWINTTRAPATRFVMVRNPYYHRVDTAGRQLPYIDRVILNVADPKLIPAKVGSGESDLQGRGLLFNNYTFLKENENRNNYRTLLWRTAKGSQVALFPNLNHNDPAWRELFRDVRFRRALSLAVDRDLVNQAIYFGLAVAGNNTVLPGSPLHKPDYLTRWARYDLREANRLLDQIGLTKRDKERTRLLPDGRPLHIIVETAGEDTEQVDVLELIRDDWAKIGVKLFTKPSQREVFRNRIFAGETLMSVWSGLENGLPTVEMSPAELAPTTQQGLQWPKWGQFFESGGKSGEAPDLPEAAELVRLDRVWRLAKTDPERAEAWHRMLAIQADQVFAIGVVGGVLQPVVARKTLRNLPDEAVWNWEPGAQFGVYRPDSFWFDDPRTGS